MLRARAASFALLSCLFLLSCPFLLASPGAAQTPNSPTTNALKLFFDCQGQTRACFEPDFYRRELPIVDWVRDREVSDVHVLVTSQSTGGGGRLFTLAFIGQSAFADQDQTLTVGTAGDATDDEERRAIVERLKMGLVRYLAQTGAAEVIRVTLGDESSNAEEDEAPSTDEVEDPWDFWVFQLGGNAFLFGESSFSSSNYSSRLSANRTTDAWKFNVQGRYNRETQDFTVTEDEVVTSLVEDWSATSLLVKSLTPQWSVGVRTDAGRSTRVNEDLRLGISPGVEYNFVPYSESTRRSITLQALLNVRRWDYVEETIYGELEETRVAPSLTLAVNQIQPWGRVNAALTGLQYLHDSSLRRVSLNGRAEFRLFRGFSLNVLGDYSWIRDQLFLSAGGFTPEEILLRQRSLETSFSYFTSFGISYRFGSIFNNVVNPRFGGRRPF